MSAARSSPSGGADTKRLPQVFDYGRTVDGLALQLRSDPAGVLEVPELPSVLVAIHVGSASEISCQRGGESHRGSAVHGDIDIIPAHTAARWEIHDQNDTALILGFTTALLATVAEDHCFVARQMEIRNRFTASD